MDMSMQYHFEKGIQMSIEPQSLMIFYQHSNPSPPNQPPIPYGVNNQKKNNTGAFMGNGYRLTLPVWNGYSDVFN